MVPAALLLNDEHHQLNTEAPGFLFSGLWKEKPQVGVEAGEKIMNK